MSMMSSGDTICNAAVLFLEVTSRVLCSQTGNSREDAPGLWFVGLYLFYEKTLEAAEETVHHRHYPI